MLKLDLLEKRMRKPGVDKVKVLADIEQLVKEHPGNKAVNELKHLLTGESYEDDPAYSSEESDVIAHLQCLDA